MRHRGRRKKQKFRSFEDYRKAEAYRHIHGIEHNEKDPYPDVEIKGRKHTVQHDRR